MKKVAVLIPAYKSFISQKEQISINHLNKYLKRYDRFLILPESIKKISFDIPEIKIVNFPNKYFSNVVNYSGLMNSKIFYEKFLNFEYILIYQLDALVFSDQLLNWCNTDYDYIGAPLFNSLIGKLSKSSASPISGGNGGLSLRKVSSFLKVIDIAESLAQRDTNKISIRKLWFLLAILTNKSHKIWLDSFPKNYPFNEDGFWSYEAPKYYPKFKIAPFEKALEFAFERFPIKCFELNNHKLPFGCHAWEKYDPEFWKPYLLK